MDLFVVPTVSFRPLYGFLVLRHCRRELLWLSVTAHPNAEWIALQLTEACGWGEAPRYMVRDRDGIYGHAFTARVEGMAIEEVRIAARSPWQNGYVERVIGSIRHECLNHIIVINDWHLRRILNGYFRYYHESRTHLSLEKDAPDSRRSTHANRGESFRFPKSEDSMTDMNAERRETAFRTWVWPHGRQSFNKLFAGEVTMLASAKASFVRFRAPRR